MLVRHLANKRRGFSFCHYSSRFISVCSPDIDLQVPSFDGHSYLKYIGLRRTVLVQSQIEVVFKPASKDGLLFYNGYSTDRMGDFLSIALSGGHVEYRFNLGTGAAVLRLARLTVPMDYFSSKYMFVYIAA